MNRFIERLFKPVDAFTVDLFARLFGILIIFHSYYLLQSGFIEKGILTPAFLFTYDYFGFVKPLSESFMQSIPYLMMGCALLMILNKWRQLAFAIFLFLFSYLFLLEKSYYNNHYYLFILVALIYIFIRPVKELYTHIKVIPYWLLLLLQFQIVVVFFYGGIAKTNYDWLVQCQPMKIILLNGLKNSLMPDLEISNTLVYIFNYGSWIFDLTIGFLLWAKKTRTIAVILCFLFNGINHFLFNTRDIGSIGVFPFFMLGTCLLFSDPGNLRVKCLRMLSFIKSKHAATQNKASRKEIDFTQNKKPILIVLGLYTTFQLLFPFRHYLIDGDVNWTSECTRFSWRMKAESKRPVTTFYFQLHPNDSMKPVNLDDLIILHQQFIMGIDPTMILQMANFLGNDLKSQGCQNPIIKVSAKVSLNGSPYYPIVDSTVNLLSLKKNPFKHANWILPLPEKNKLTANLSDTLSIEINQR